MTLSGALEYHVNSPPKVHKSKQYIDLIMVNNAMDCPKGVKRQQNYRDFMETHRERHTDSELVALHHKSEERYDGYENGCTSPKQVEHDRIYTSLEKP